MKLKPCTKHRRFRRQGKFVPNIELCQLWKVQLRRFDCTALMPRITGITAWQVDLPLKESRYVWSDGKFVGLRFHNCPCGHWCQNKWFRRNLSSWLSIPPLIPRGCAHRNSKNRPIPPRPGRHAAGCDKPGQWRGQGGRGGSLSWFNQATGLVAQLRRQICLNPVWLAGLRSSA